MVTNPKPMINDKCGRPRHLTVTYRRDINQCFDFIQVENKKQRYRICVRLVFKMMHALNQSNQSINLKTISDELSNKEYPHWLPETTGMSFDKSSLIMKNMAFKNPVYFWHEYEEPTIPGFLFFSRFYLQIIIVV